MANSNKVTYYPAPESIIGQYIAKAREAQKVFYTIKFTDGTTVLQWTSNTVPHADQPKG